MLMTVLIVEALTNVATYAHATHARMTHGRENGHARVELRDNRGGVNPDSNSGLRGLADRVSALDGHLMSDSRPGGGTTIAAEIPCSV